METMYVVIGTVKGRNGDEQGVTSVSSSTSAETAMEEFRRQFVAGMVYSCRISETAFVEIKRLAEDGKGGKALSQLKAYSYSMQPYMAVS
jgi:hypothetical protein